MRKVILCGALVLTMGGCQTMSAASIRGACDAFDRPGEPIRGLERKDQRWIDRTIEAGVSACGWSRPKARAVVNAAVGR